MAVCRGFPNEYEKEKSRPGCCNIQNGTAVEKCTQTQFHRPLFYHTERGNAMIEVSSFLKHGRENAISSAELCKATGATPRALRHCIAAERATGVEILYSPDGQSGYFLPSLDPVKAKMERQAFYHVMKARAVCTCTALRPVARALGVPAVQVLPVESEA